MSSSDTGVGGLKEVIATIEGRGAYSKLRMQKAASIACSACRPPRPAARVHTSTATVAVLPEAERSTSRSRTRTCASTPSVRAALRTERQHHLLRGPNHPPSHERRRLAAGREVADQEQGEGDEGAALPLCEMELRKQQEAIAKDRRSQVGTGERSEKIRTQLPQNRITDHPDQLHDPSPHRGTQRGSAGAAGPGDHSLSIRKAQGCDRCQLSVEWVSSVRWVERVWSVRQVR